MIGVYAFIPKGQLDVAYIGHSKNVQKRIMEHFRNDRPFTTSSWILYQPFQTKEEAYDNEQLLIYKHKPWYNKTRRKDKIIPTPWECESINDVLTGYEHPPWRPLGVVDQCAYNVARQRWIDQGRNKE